MAANNFTKRISGISVSVELTVRKYDFGRIIGKAGRVIQDIQKSTNTVIDLGRDSKQGRADQAKTIKIIGKSAEDVEQAKAAILRIVESHVKHNTKESLGPTESVTTMVTPGVCIACGCAFNSSGYSEKRQTCSRKCRFALQQRKLDLEK